MILNKVLEVTKLHQDYLALVESKISFSKIIGWNSTFNNDLSTNLSKLNYKIVTQ